MTSNRGTDLLEIWSPPVEEKENGRRKEKSKKENLEETERERERRESGLSVRKGRTGGGGEC